MSEERAKNVHSVQETRRKYEEQDQWGNSIASLRSNLRLTMLERLQRAEANLSNLEELRNALKRTS